MVAVLHPIKTKKVDIGETTIVFNVQNRCIARIVAYLIGLV